jgi:hypothetical protein
VKESEGREKESRMKKKAELRNENKRFYRVYRMETVLNTTASRSERVSRRFVDAVQPLLERYEGGRVTMTDVIVELSKVCRLK